MTFICWIVLLVLGVTQSHAQGVEVSAKIVVNKILTSADKKHKDSPETANVVLWLSSLKPDPPTPPPPARQTPYRLVQKNKMFTPNLLVVPAGTSVEFPNEDPFFHNVFSLFNGKRFDLGLYESGTSRAVRFDREGVSYIFCNIHPEMGAVVLALGTPYYAVSTLSGAIDIHDVPPGNYHLHTWSETAKSVGPADPEKVVQIETAPAHLDEITMEEVASPMENHKNKFGDDYHTSHGTPY